MMIFMLVSETIATTDFGSDLFLLRELFLTKHTGYCWSTMLQMVFSLLVCQVPLIQMLVLRNKLGSQLDSRSTYQKILALNTCTFLINVQLLLLDVFFMVITLCGGYLSLFMQIISCGRLK